MFLVVTRNFPPDVGGMQTLMGGLSESLLDYEPVKVFTYQFANSNIYDSKSSVDIQRISGMKFFRKFRKANLVNNFINTNSNIRAIITDHWKSLELLKTEYSNKSKTFCLLHSKEINHKLGSSLNKRLIKSTNKADFIVANSNFTKELGISVGLDSSKLKVIYPGIQRPKFIEEKFKIKAEKIFGDSFPKIITVARLEKRKSHEKILMSIKNLKGKFSNIRYVSIGKGDEDLNLKNLCKELSLEKEVIFLKNIDENLKIALISKSNLFLMPSVIYKKSVEGFGISYIEAASYGVASIGGKDGGASDAITHNKTGLICDGNDLNSIYEAINLFFKDSKFLQFGKAAQAYSENFYWNKIIKKYLDLIN